jgi:hypothetical protein
MAGDDNGKLVFSASRTGRPHSARSAGGNGDLGIGSSLAGRNGAQGFPHLLLKCRALNIYR